MFGASVTDWGASGTDVKASLTGRRVLPVIGTRPPVSSLIR